MARKFKAGQQASMFERAPNIFGGSLLKGNPKSQRPLSTKAPLHLVLKTRHGFGRFSMLHPRHVKAVDHYVRKHAKRNGVRIYHFVNAGNHIHLVVRLHNRRLFRRFVRTVAGLIARRVLGRERGKARSRGALAGANGKGGAKTSYWISRPFTRVARWGRDYRNLRAYMAKNRIQADRLGMRRDASPITLRVEGFDWIPSARDLYEDTA